MSFYSGVTEITSNEFNGKDLVRPYSGYVVFYASWCGYCQSLKPLLQSLGNKVNIIAINCDKPNELCERFGVQGYPTITYFKKGIFGGIYQGDRTPQALTDFYTRNLADSQVVPSPIPLPNGGNIHGQTYHPYYSFAIKYGLPFILFALLFYILFLLFSQKKEF
jgi:thioredoxin domain-containing protein 5